MQESVWERTDSVQKFAKRDPDLRMLDLLAGYSDPASVRVLDLGCAAGRNTVVLAERGFDVHARDGSRAMTSHTEQRLAAILGDEKAERRVRRGAMDDLTQFDDCDFELVVALGVYHCASSREEWDRSLDESARVLAPGGRLLVAVFTPETDLHGTGIRLVSGEEHLYDGFSSGRTFLVDAETLDAQMAQRGLTPAAPTKTVSVPLEKGRRVVANALYQKTPRRSLDRG